jgi:hypothetical protein
MAMAALFKPTFKLYITTLVLLFTAPVTFASTHYETLGVTQNASQEQIKAMYRKLAMKYHPDRFSDSTPEMAAQAEARFKEINTAYSVLSDERKRFAYDQNPLAQARGGSFSVDADAMVENLKNSVHQGPLAVSQALRDIATNFETLIDAAETVPKSRVFFNFYAALDAIAKRPELATTQIFSDLMFMNSAQELVYYMRPDLNYYQGRFNTSEVGLTAGMMLKSLATKPNINLPELFAALTDYTTVTERTTVLTRSFEIRPIFRQEMSNQLYELGVQSGMIRDAKTLRFFIQNVVRKILDNERREPVDIPFLSSNLPYTLQILKTSSYEDILYIMDNLTQLESVKAYEELVRSGALAKMTAEQVLTLLKRPRLWADRYLDGKFGPDYQQLGQKLEARIKSANLAFTRDFSRLSPTSEQMKEFAVLSSFKFGEYTWSKLKPKPMPPRDYEVHNLIPAAKVLPESQSLGYTKTMILECRVVFAN